MKRRVVSFIAIAALAMFACTLSASAQTPPTATFTWNAGCSYTGGWVGTPICAPSDVESFQFATINGLPSDQSIGYAGSYSITNGLWLGLWLPYCASHDPITDACIPFGWPNNGAIQGFSCSEISWSAKQWGNRQNPDGTTTPMDGTEAGDYYTVSTTVTCNEWNGSISATINQFHEFEYRKHCVRGGRGGCYQYGVALADIYVNGSGSATILSCDSTCG